MAKVKPLMAESTFDVVVIGGGPGGYGCAIRAAQLGFKVAIYPNSLTRLFARVGQDLLGSLRSTGNTAAMANQMLDHGQLWSLFENERWQALEKRFQG